MGLVLDIFNFFCPSNSGEREKSLMSFLETRPGFIIQKGDDNDVCDYTLMYSIFNLCNKMILDGLLMKCPGANCSTPFSAKYISLQADKNDLNYGAYDFKYQGPIYIREYFKGAVRPIVGENKKGVEDIGTAFYIGNNLFVTAKHCVEGLSSFNIKNESMQNYQLKEVLFPKDDEREIDIAIIKIGGDLIKDIPAFQLDNPIILENVLTMGYPPVAGLDSILLAEKSYINSPIILKSSTGEILGDGYAYLSRINHFLINARVKGGNSGGPVINEYGKVVGIVIELPYDFRKPDSIDLMGFGICISSQYIEEILEDSGTIIKQLVHSNDHYQLESL